MPGMARHRIGEQVEPAFPDAVPHPVALAVKPIVQNARPDPVGRRRCDDEAQIGLAADPFDLGDDPAGVAPTAPCVPDEIPEAVLRLATVPLRVHTCIGSAPITRPAEQSPPI